MGFYPGEAVDKCARWEHVNLVVSSTIPKPFNISECSEHWTKKVTVKS